MTKKNIGTISRNHGYGLFSKTITIFLFSVVCLTWGTTWIAIRIAVETVPPVTASGLRFLIAFPMLFLIGRASGEPLFFPRAEMKLFALVTIAYFMLPYILINVGEQSVSSGLASLLFSSMPVFIVVFAAAILKERIGSTQIAGIVLGFLSLAGILHQRGAEFAFENVWGIPAILAAAMLHALCYVITKKRGANIGVITFNTLPIGISGISITLAGISAETVSFHDVSTQSCLALIYLGIVASVGGFLAYFYLLKRSSPVLLSFVFLIFPVVSILIESVVENRPISVGFAALTITMLIGFGLTKITDLRMIVEKLGVSGIIRKRTKEESVLAPLPSDASPG